MKWIFLLLVVAAAALAMGMGVGPVAAQDGENTTANETRPDVEFAFDDTLRVLDYELEDGEATITFESNLTQTAEVTDAMDGIGKDGIVSPYSREYNLSRGETTITMDVSEVRGASAVSIAANGKTARVSSEFEKDPHDPLQYFGGMSGLFTGIGLTVVVFGGAAWYVVRREDSGVIKA